jgi:DNA sulfur modification protein DndB
MTMASSQEIQYTFPAVRGVQAGREYYVTVLPLRMLERLFRPGAEVPGPADRAQRRLSGGRVPGIARYITGNPDTYVLPALTTMIDADVRFFPAGDAGIGRRAGVLEIPRPARFTLSDGQHRVAAIAHALREDRRGFLGDEAIPVVLFVDIGLARSQQAFADLNRHAVRPAPSISILYDQRDEAAVITRHVIDRVPLFHALTDLERTSLPRRSARLFTLSGLHTATQALFAEHEELSLEARKELAVACWAAVAAHFPDWEKVARGELPAFVMREDRIHSSALVLHALGRIGGTLITPAANPVISYAVLDGLQRIDWRRTAPGWEGRAVTGGRLAKSHARVLLTAAAIRRALGMPLPTDEQQLDAEFRRDGN